MDGELHAIVEAMAATPADEVVGFDVGEIEDVAAAPSDVLDVVPVYATLVACLVHLQNVVVVLVKPKICTRSTIYNTTY